MKRDEALRVYTYLLDNAGLTTYSTADEKLSCQRAIYRIYQEEVDGYIRKLDHGFDNGTTQETKEKGEIK